MAYEWKQDALPAKSKALAIERGALAFAGLRACAAGSGSQRVQEVEPSPGRGTAVLHRDPANLQLDMHQRYGVAAPHGLAPSAAAALHGAAGGGLLPQHRHRVVAHPGARPLLGGSGAGAGVVVEGGMGGERLVQ